MTIEEIKELLEAGEIGKARALLIGRVQDDPDDHRAWLLLAGIATRSEDWTLGESAFTALVRLRPLDGLASSGMVQSLVKQGRHPEALDEIERFRRVADRSKASSDAVLQEHQATLEQLKSIG